MKKILYIGLILAAFVACSKEEGTIMGSASANGGEILSGITVKLHTTESVLYKTTTTDTKGDFVFSNLEKGNYHIGATVIAGTDTFDTGNVPRIVYVNDEIVKEVSLSLSAR